MLKEFLIMYRYNLVIVFLVFLIKLNPAYSMFGQSDVPLIEYYEFGKKQTGVALVRTTGYKGDTYFGTANLIDVEVESLKGRLLITCTHVLNNTLRNTGTVKFMDEENMAQTIAVQEFFCNPGYAINNHTDIAFILLREAVDTHRFKPLKLNLTRNNEALKGLPVDVFGCSPLFGKADCHMVFCDHDDSTLRRGMNTVISSSSDDSFWMESHFYDRRGFVKFIRKPPTKEELWKLKNATPQPVNQEISDFLRSDRIKIRCFEPIILYYTEHFQSDLEKLMGNRASKTSCVMLWENLIKDKNSQSAVFELSDCQIFMYKPLPRLSAQLFHGDSGGAWVQGDEIVALSSRVICKGPGELYEMQRKFDATLSTEDYFAQCEQELADIKRLGMADPLIDVLSTSTGISIWSHRDWIQATLKEIVAQCMITDRHKT